MRYYSRNDIAKLAGVTRPTAGEWKLPEPDAIISQYEGWSVETWKEWARLNRPALLPELDKLTPEYLAERTLRGYVTAKAREAARKAFMDGDADLSEMIEWGLSAKRSDARDTGIIVDRSGHIHATTDKARDEVRGYSVDFVADRKERGLTYSALGMAMSELRQRMGEDVIHLTFWDLCSGQTPR